MATTNKTRDLLIQVRSLLRRGDYEDLLDAGLKMSQLDRSGSPELYRLSLETDFWDAAVNYILGPIRNMNCDYHILHFAARWRKSIPEEQRQGLPPGPEAKIINAYGNLLAVYHFDEDLRAPRDVDEGEDDDFDPFEMCNILCEAFFSLVQVNGCTPSEKVQQAMRIYVQSPEVSFSGLMDVLLGFSWFDDFHESPTTVQLSYAEHVLRQFLSMQVVFKATYFASLKYILTYTDETGVLLKYGTLGDGRITALLLMVIQKVLDGLNASRLMNVGLPKANIEFHMVDLLTTLKKLISGCNIDLRRHPTQLQALKQFFCKEIDSQGTIDQKRRGAIFLLDFLKLNENILPAWSTPDLFTACFNLACEAHKNYTWEILSLFLFSDMERTLLPTTTQLIDKVDNIIKSKLKDKSGDSFYTADFAHFIEFLAALCRHTLIAPACGCRSASIPRLLVVALDIPVAKSGAAHGLADLFTLSIYRERLSSTIDPEAKMLLLNIVNARMYDEAAELQYFVHCFLMVSNLAKHSTLQQYLGCCSLSCTLVRAVEMCEVDAKDPEMIKGFKELAITTMLCCLINVARWNDAGKDSFTQHHFIDQLFEPILRQYTYDPLITELMFHAWFTLCSGNEWATRDTTQGAELRKSIIMAFDKWKDNEKIAMRACKFIRLLCRDTKVVSKLFAKLKVADIIKQSKASPAFKNATLSCFGN